MEQEKSDATSGEVRKHVTGRIMWGNPEQNINSREVGWTTFTLVYSQESLRVLDLRLNIPELDDVGAVGELFTAAARGIILRVATELINS